MFGRVKSMFGKMTGRDKDANRFFDNPGFRMVWEQKRLPGPGAMNYAYESLALAGQSPISGAVAQRGQLNPTKPNTEYVFQAVPLDGLPMVNGQMILQPLYDPERGYVSVIPTEGSTLTAFNIPASLVQPIPLNAVDPTQL